MVDAVGCVPGADDVAGVMTETRKRRVVRHVRENAKGYTITLSATTLAIAFVVVSGLWDIGANLIASWLAPHVGLAP